MQVLLQDLVNLLCSSFLMFVLGRKQAFIKKRKKKVTRWRPFKNQINKWKHKEKEQLWGKLQKVALGHKLEADRCDVQKNAENF